MMSDELDSLGEPYPGLRSFRRDETHIFFGRETTINEMVDRLAAHRFLAVTGISGSGKSSLVRTGLLDALDRGLLAEAGSDWRVADFRPGAQPLLALVEGLAEEVKAYESDSEVALVEAKLARGPMGLVEWLEEIHFPAGANLLLLVDQFEEIFRYRQGPEGEGTDAFVALLVASAKQRKIPIYVVITMRSDFLGDCAQFAALAETINDGQFLTPRLTRDQCRAAIEGPAAVYGGRVEPVLVTRMLNDMGGNPDQLPLMQHILMLLWHKASKRADKGRPELTLVDYEALGGIGAGLHDPATTVIGGEKPSWFRGLFGGGRRRTPAGVAIGDGTQPLVSNGALSDHADQVLATLSPEQQHLAEILFRALTGSEGIGGRDTRRPVTLADAAAIADVPIDAIVPVAAPFRAAGVNFLTPAAPTALRPETMLDISHESLIRQWVTLRQWVRQEFQSAETYRDVEKSAKRWYSGLGNLLMKLDLAVARKWRKTEHPNAAWAARYGDAFPLAMEFLRRSERSRLVRRGIAVTAASVVMIVVLSTTMLALYMMAVVTNGLSYVNPEDEWTNFGVSPQVELRKGVIANTPVAIPGGRVIGTAALESALNKGALDGMPFLAIDVWQSTLPHPAYIPGSIFIPYAGEYGTFKDDTRTNVKDDSQKNNDSRKSAQGDSDRNLEDDTQRKLREELARLTKDNANMPLVFFCTGAKCWESYNASLRAIKLGYTNVYWYRGGIGSWGAAHRPYPIDLSRVPVSWSGTIMTGLGTLKDVVWPDPEYHYRRGVEYTTNKQYDDAITELTKTIELNHKHVEAYKQRGLAYLSKGDLDIAITDFDMVIKLNPAKSGEIQTILRMPKYALAYFNRGNAYYAKGDNERAIRDYTQAIELDPAYAVAYYNRGNVYSNLDDYDRAITDYDQAIKLDPKYSAAYGERGFARYYKGDYDLAIRDFDRQIELDPKSAPAYNGRAYAYSEKNDYDRAIKDFDNAIELDANYVSAYNGRGNAYFNKRDYDRAIKDYDEAIAKNPRYTFAFNNRGNAYYRKGELDRAIQDYNKAIEINPKYAAAFNNRGYAYYLKGDYDDALEDYDQAIAINPKYARALYNRGETHAAKGEFDLAIKEYNKVIEIDSKDVDSFWSLGRAEIYSGRAPSAAGHLATAVTLDPKNAYIMLWLHIARIRAGQNDVEEFAANARRVDESIWPWPVFSLFLGKTTPQAVRAAAEDTNDPGVKRDRVCEADFYTGVYLVARNEREEAGRLFQSAASSCPIAYIERNEARHELDQLH